MDRGPHHDHQCRGLEAPADLSSGLATSPLADVTSPRFGHPDPTLAVRRIESDEVVNDKCDGHVGGHGEGLAKQLAGLPRCGACRDVRPVASSGRPGGPAPPRDWGVWGMLRKSCGPMGDVLARPGPSSSARQLGVGIAAVWLLTGCGSGQSPTEAARLAESRRAEAETAKTPDVVDALFLGTGPLIPRDGATDCPLQGFWSGYPRGTLASPPRLESRARAAPRPASPQPQGCSRGRRGAR